MSRNRIALYTTVYPQALRFLEAWQKSVVEQTDQGFDLWVGIDKLSVAAVAPLLSRLSRRHWVVGSDGDNGITVRLRAMEQMVSKYDGVVFADSDDVLLPTRLAAARQSLENYDVTGCALTVIDEGGKPLGPIFGPSSPDVDWANLLPRYNVFGLSNSAYRTQMLARCLPFTRDCALTDWFLATRAWVLGARLGFDPEPQMHYRQYATNTARVVPPFRPDDVLTATRRVLVHYELVLQVVDRLDTLYRIGLEMAQAKVMEFHQVIRRSWKALQRYTQELNRLPPRFVWWWAVAHPELEKLWKN
ncbi:MAG: hypothetical protein L0387_36685 [Acidobacteria bacterium]|nr:hypothetical protein [Acidobacteriota bacterium]